MRHGINISGLSFGLRPVCPADAAFIFDLRSDPRLAAYINETVDRQSHYSWMEHYYEREQDYYFVVTDMATGTPQGTCALYNFDADSRGAEWGRWIITPSSLAAAESAYLCYSLAFEHFGLERLICRTIAGNAQTLAFHKRCGLIVSGVQPKAVSIRGCSHDLVEHMITREIWSDLKPNLLRKCAAVSSILRRRTLHAAVMEGDK